MQTFASIALLALVAPIFAVPFEQLEARDYYDDNTPSSVVVFAVPTTAVSVFAIPTTADTLFPSQFRIAPSPTSDGAPEHTGAHEEGEDGHSRFGHPFPSGTGVPHHTHHTHTHTHTGTFKLHPTGKPHEGFESFRSHHKGESYDDYESFKLHPTGEPHERYENRISSFRFNAVTNLIHSHHPY